MESTPLGEPLHIFLLSWTPAVVINLLESGSISKFGANPASVADFILSQWEQTRVWGYGKEALNITDLKHYLIFKIIVSFCNHLKEWNNAGKAVIDLETWERCDNNRLRSDAYLMH